MAISLGVSLSSASTTRFQGPSASLNFHVGTTSRRTTSSSLNVTSSSTRSGLLHCSFVSSPTSLSFPSSSLSGLSLGVSFDFNKGVIKHERRFFVVRAGKAALCLTKRNRSRKSLARTHGFRRRMRTTSGRAVLKRRRAKGRKILCTKTNSNSGKRA